MRLSEVKNWKFCSKEIAMAILCKQQICFWLHKFVIVNEYANAPGFDVLVEFIYGYDEGYCASGGVDYGSSRTSINVQF